MDRLCRSMLVGLWLGLLCGCQFFQSGPPQTVVLVTIDTLRADHLSFNGYHEATAPFLASRAQRGINFTQAYAPCSWTPVSMASLFTSLYPRSHGVRYSAFNTDTSFARPVLRDELTLLPERMKAAGFRTIGVAANVHLSKSLGFSQGFDHYYDRAEMIDAGQLDGIIEHHLREAYGEEWKTAWKKDRLFLWIHWLDPHSPYTATPDWVGPRDRSLLSDRQGVPTGRPMTQLENMVHSRALEEQLRILYDGEIFRVDRHLRKFWETMGFDDNVLLMVAADHGEEFFDHGQLDHAKTLNEEVVHVPFFISRPGSLTQATTDTPVSLLDVQPTLLDLLELPQPEGQQGMSLVPLLRGGSLPTRPLFFELLRPGEYHLLGMREGTTKLITGPGDSARMELYDLATDPHEKHNLAQTQRTQAEAARTRLLKAYQALPEGRVDMAPAPSEDELRQLKATGYIQ